MKTDPRIDAYISGKADFARPILDHIRHIVHTACPQVEETLKWSMPHFTHRGAIICNMAAFKAHCAFGIWAGREIVGDGASNAAMGQLGKIASLADLPDDADLAAMLRKRVADIEAGVKRTAPAQPRAALEPPDDLLAALEDAPTARATFDGFSPSNRRDYVEWVIEAKRPETRTKRIAQAVTWMAEGKPRHWKYQNC